MATMDADDQYIHELLNELGIETAHESLDVANSRDIVESSVSVERSDKSKLVTGPLDQIPVAVSEETKVEEEEGQDEFKEISFTRTSGKDKKLKRGLTFSGSLKTLGRTLSVRLGRKGKQVETKEDKKEVYRKMIKNYSETRRLEDWTRKYQATYDEAVLEARTIHDVFPTESTDVLTRQYLEAGRNVDLAITLHLRKKSITTFDK